MSEEKEPKTPPEEGGEGAPEEGGAPEGGEEGKPEEGKAEPDVQAQLKILGEKLEGLETKNEELTGRNEVLQDSLDSALEEMALKSGTPKAEGEEGGEEEKGSEEEKGEEGKEGKPEEGKETAAVEKEIEASIKEEEEFRVEQEEKIEGILTRETVRDLEAEVKSALGTYPSASRSEILLAIEDGSEESVGELAKASHEIHSKKLDDLKTKHIEEFKEQLKEEGEGGISVPQSPGTSKAPVTPKSEGQPPAPGQGPGLREESEWGDALEKAKVEGGGV